MVMILVIVIVVIFIIEIAIMLTTLIITSKSSITYVIIFKYCANHSFLLNKHMFLDSPDYGLVSLCFDADKPEQLKRLKFVLFKHNVLSIFQVFPSDLMSGRPRNIFTKRLPALRIPGEAMFAFLHHCNAVSLPRCIASSLQRSIDSSLHRFLTAMLHRFHCFLAVSLPCCISTSRPL